VTCPSAQVFNQPFDQPYAHADAAKSASTAELTDRRSQPPVLIRLRGNVFDYISILICGLPRARHLKMAKRRLALGD
jgi:hypothetical protein